MKTIYKYEIVNGEPIRLKKGAKFISFSYQQGRPFAWFVVDTNNKDELRTFYVLGTGHHIPGDASYLATTHEDKPFVWHLFESIK